MLKGIEQFEKEINIPNEYRLKDDFSISYRISGIQWTRQASIALESKAVVKVPICSYYFKCHNVTYVPSHSSVTRIPINTWPLFDKDVETSTRLLQGVRINSEFISAMMWYAAKKHVTKYQPKFDLMDAKINATVTYSPPKIVVTQDDVLGIQLDTGLVWISCLPVDETDQQPKTLMKIEFEDLASSASVVMARELTKTGIRVHVDQMDLSNIKTKPVEPKLPLPQGLEGLITRKLLSKMRPVLNAYLASKLLFLPQKIRPVVAHPKVRVFKTAKDRGYIELTSYCTCDKSDTQTTQCSDKSSVCDPKSRNFESTEKSYFERLNEKTGKVNYDKFYEAIVQKVDSMGYFVTLYDDSDRCTIDKPGSHVKVYWLWRTTQCSPMFMFDTVDSFYQFNENKLSIECDELCLKCGRSLVVPDAFWKHETCTNSSASQSYTFSQPLLTGMDSEYGSKMLMVHLFTVQECTYQSVYKKSQLISMHTSLGKDNTTDCSSSKDNNVYNTVSKNAVLDARWDCDQHCNVCDGNVSQVILGHCIKYANSSMSAMLFHTKETKAATRQPIQMNDAVNYFAIVAGLLTLAGIVLCLLIGIILRSKFTIYQAKQMLSSAATNIWNAFGFRPKLIKSRKRLMREVVENALVLVNGVMALAFAQQWLPDRSPLRLPKESLKSYSNKINGLFEDSTVNSFINKVDNCMIIGNYVNGCVAFVIIAIWCFTKFGRGSFWTKVRLYSAAWMQIFAFLTMVGFIFSQYLDELLVLAEGTGNPITDIKDFRAAAVIGIKLAVNGVSMTIMSFAMVLLFHSVGCGLYCGAIMFKLLHMDEDSLKINMLSTMITILTFMQPFICLHPTVIWTQNSIDNTMFLILEVSLWFTPVICHCLVRPVISALVRMMKACLCIAHGDWKNKKHRIVCCFEFILHLFMLIGFMTGCWLLNREIIELEFSRENRLNLKPFVLTTIIATFCWFASMSYFIMSINLDISEKDARDFKEKVLNGENCDTFEANIRKAPVNYHQRQRDNSFVVQEAGVNVRARIAEIERMNLMPIRANQDVLITQPQEQKKSNRFKRIRDFLLENKELPHPEVYGWRIQFRRIFLTFGVIGNVYSTCHEYYKVQVFSSQREVQQLLNNLEVNFTWPSSGTQFDRTFELFNEMERYRVYILLFTSGMFVISLGLDYLSSLVKAKSAAKRLFHASVMVNFVGGVSIFVSVILLGIPDYLASVDVDTFCPKCGERFNLTMTQFSNFAIGFFFATLFTFKLKIVLITISPAMVRASVLLITHPSVLISSSKEVRQGKTGQVRVSLLYKMIELSSMVAIPITFLTMATVQQYTKNEAVLFAILAFWILPFLVLQVGLTISNKYKKKFVLFIVYYSFNLVYLASLFCILIAAIDPDKVLTRIGKELKDVNFYANFLSSIFICNVVISDMLCLML